MVLTAENYYSQEANEEYMSVSQFKDFCGTYGKMPCEFTAMEKLKGRWEEPKSKALMVGSYVDSYFEGTLDKFKAENPDLFKRDGTLKAEFVKADEIIQRIERDDYFMKFMSGKKQVIMTGELFGTKWKIKMDSYIQDIAIVDLKVMASITKLEWVRDEKRVGEAVGYTIYARSGTRADLNAYITTNREEEATALANGKKIKRPAESKLQPLDCSMLPRDYEIKEDSKVQVIPVKAAEAQYYRELWTHNFVGSSATFNRALLIDGYVAGVFGISKMASDSVFVWYVMKVPHKIYRLGRLCYMLAQNREFVDTLLDNIEQEKVTKMRTAMLTRYPENKEVRGIMKLVNRVEDKKNGYKLTYEAELVEGRSEQQTLQEWLRRENEWQKNRAKASSKSKGAK